MQVLVAKGYEDLVTTRRPVAQDGDDAVKRLGKRERHAVYAPFNLRQIVEFILLLPLNFIPVAGVPLFIFLVRMAASEALTRILKVNNLLDRISGWPTAALEVFQIPRL